MSDAGGHDDALGLPYSKVLVTGASGFVGQHLLRHLIAEFPTVQLVAWQRRAALEDTATTSTGVQWRTVDLLTRDAVVKALEADRPEAVIHLAGAAHVGNSWKSPVTPLAVNVMGTHHLFEACRRLKLMPRVVVSGSATVYAPSPEPLTEASRLGPVNPYGLSKLAQEALCRLVYRHDGIPVVVTRSFNHIGPGQHPGFFASAFARQLAQIEAGLIPARVTVGNLDARRDLMDVRDTVRAYVALLRAGSAGECYNVCAGRDYRIGVVLERLVAHLTCAVEVIVDAAKLRPNDVPLVVGSAARLTSDTGWAPHIDLDSSLGELLQWWRDEIARGAPHALPDHT